MAPVQPTSEANIDRRGWGLSAIAFAAIIPGATVILAGAWAPGLLAVGLAAAFMAAFVAHAHYWTARYPRQPNMVLLAELVSRIGFVTVGALGVAYQAGAWRPYLLVAVPWALVNWRVHQVIVKGLTGYRADVALVTWGLFVAGLLGAWVVGLRLAG